MRRKVIPFPLGESTNSRPVPQGHTCVTVHLGARRYTLNIPCAAEGRPPESVSSAPPKRVEELQVQTRFLRLREAAKQGDRIDGWRVCWVGGWDKGRVLFIVMVERVVRSAQT